MEECIVKLQEEDKIILELMIDDEDNTSRELEDEQDTVIQYKQKWLDLERQISEFLNPTTQNTEVFQDNGYQKGSLGEKRACRLPELELKKFDGTWLEWLGWWAQFSTIHEDTRLSSVDKFQYLVQSMKENTRASRLVRSYPITADNYPKAIAALKDRFGDRVILTEVCVRQLLGLVVNNARRKTIGIEDLYDRLESYLRSLESLGITIEQYAAFLYPLVESGLPEELLTVWQRSALAGYNDEDEDTPQPVDGRLGSLLKFLRREVKGQKRLAYKRRGVLMRHRACFKCFRVGHHACQCWRDAECGICKKSHNTLLHLGECLMSNRGPSSTKENIHPKTESNAEKPDVSFAGMHVRTAVPTALLATALVRLVNHRNEEKVVRALLDQGSQSSFIHRDVLQGLNIPVSKVDAQIYGINATKGEEVKDLAHFAIKPIGNQNWELPLQALVVNKMTGLLPSRDLRLPITENFRDIQVADPQFTKSGRIDIILGADVYGLLLLPEIRRDDKTQLCAQNTKLGWIISGGLSGGDVGNTQAFTTRVQYEDNLETILKGFWEVEEVPVANKITPQDEFCEELYKKGVRRDTNGRYIVPLPFDPRLNAFNYNIWKVDMKVLLIDRGSWDFIIEDEPDLPAEATAKDIREFKWRKDRAFTTIYQGVERKYQTLIANAANGKEAWNILKQNFEPNSRARLAGLIDEFYELKFAPDEETIGIFIKRVQEKKQLIEEAGFDLPEVLVCFQLIRKLPQDYDGIVQVLYRLEEKQFNVENIEAHLITESGRVQQKKKDDGLDIVANAYQTKTPRMYQGNKKKNYFSAKAYPEQNGIAERFNRTAIEGVRAMLLDSGLQPRFWAEALNTFVYTKNRCEHALTKGVSPMELWSGHKPSVRHFKIFGSLAYVHVPNMKRNKLQPKANSGIMVGYATKTKGYRIWLPADRKVIETIHVFIDEAKKGVDTLFGTASRVQYVFYPQDDDYPYENNDSDNHNLHTLTPIDIAKWKRLEIPRKTGPRVDVYYYPPSGDQKLRSLNDVQKYCETQKLEFNSEMFSFRPQKPDISEENEVKIETNCLEDDLYESVFHEEIYNVELPKNFNDVQQSQEKRNWIKAMEDELKVMKKIGKCVCLLSFLPPNNKFMEEYEGLGHMTQLTEIPVGDQTGHCYLPHHAVLGGQPDRRKFRVVFDASAKTKNGFSFNDRLYIGAKLQRDILSILMNCRKHRIFIMSDIEKMYRQILVRPSDAERQRIIWRRRSQDKLIAYRLNTVTYGTAAAPFLAMRTLLKLVEDEGAKYPRASRAIKEDIYVDDIITGADDLRDGMALRDELIELLRCGGFTLKKWSSNDPTILGNIAKEHCAQKIMFEQSKVIRTLGLGWIQSEDCFVYDVQSLEKTSVTTKREMLSFIAKLYDPLGWLAPVLVTGKIMVQRLWITGLHWDDPMDESLIETWTKFRKELNFIRSLRIPRWLGLGRNTQGVQLHGFGDASEDAYAEAVYIIIPTDDGVSVKLLASKIKLAPIQKMSIPRLELCAALLLTRLMKYIMEELNITMESATCWSDSTIVLGWLRTMSRTLPTFIGNRVAEIQSCPQSSIWWTGPTWLSAESTEWPRKLPVFENQSQIELLSVHAISETPFLVAIGEMNSTFNGYIRKVAWILRFCHNCRYSAERYQSHLTTDELRNAHRRILQAIQCLHFKEEIKGLTTLGSVKRTSKIYGLTPFLDDQGILRVGGRLKWAPSMTYEQKHPALLPSSGKVAQMIVQAVHMRTLHGSVHLMLSTLRQKYWMLRAKDQVKRCIRECVTCCRYNRVTQGQLMSDLPKERLTPGKPFSISGVDYAGPVNLRLSKGRGRKTEKGYICLFVCFVTRAVHLELVTDASTPTFMSAFKRFVARRGHCTRLYSDQGTNFVGAARQLRSRFYLAQNQLKELAAVLANDGTEWKFNPPGAPHFGGLWEARVKALKYHMRRIIGNNLLTYEELLTVLVQIESCLNSRPLYPMSNDPNDQRVLTPAHFLLTEPSSCVPEDDLLLVKNHLLTRWQLVQRVLQHLWKRWSKDYLNNLQQRNKWKTISPNVDIDTLVLIKEERMPPARWLMGRVVETHPGKDGLVRVVSVRTSVGVLRRPL
ncbi:hypothetical protein LAZ67_11001138, partial [Cordylochernes scorpioides]